MVEIRSALLSMLCAVLFLDQVGGSNHKSHRHHSRLRESQHNLDNQEYDDVLSNQVDEDEQRLALEHSERVAEAGLCELPKSQVVHVSDHYPGRYYLPHCTLLHRCGKHAGCCGTDRLKCVAEKKEKVVLHFYSVRIVGHGVPPERKIEKLTFTNHTKCGCTPVEDYKNDL